LIKIFYIGTIIFGEIASKMYEYNISNTSKTCLGPNCFKAAFLISTGACSLGVIVCILLYLHQKRAKNSTYYTIKENNIQDEELVNWL